MNVLFVHQTFPGQFGPFAFRLATRPGVRVAFANAATGETVRGVEGIRYRVAGGATAATHYCSRTFENAVSHAHAVHEAMRARPDFVPDVVVGHSGFGSTLFLRELYPAAKIVNLFEYFYRTTDSDMDFRPEFPPPPLDLLRARARNAMILLDLDNCDAGYCPTAWQLSRFPAEYRPKLRTLFDGIDTEVWRPAPGGRRGGLRQLGDRAIPPGTKLVTYVARGFEAMRGFDVFLRAAGLLARKRPDVLFAVVGSDRVVYGGDAKHTGESSFKAWALKRYPVDLSRFVFTGPLPEAALARLLAASDLHIYLTVPFVLSWSLVNAMACGAVVLASDTAPVRELVTHGVTGRLADFFDPQDFAEQADGILTSPDESRHLGDAAADLVRRRYSLDACWPGFDDLLRTTLSPSPRPLADSQVNP